MKDSISLTVLVGLVIISLAHVAESDTNCRSRGGTCKYTRERCSGTFTRGLCNGPYQRQCCVPRGGGTGGGSSGGSCGVVTRASWGARSPKSTSRMRTPVSLVFIHHTAGATCSSSSSCAREARNTQNYHMDRRGYQDVGYNFLVGGDGKVYEGRGWDRVGGHTYGYNSRSVAISFMGNFMRQSPTAAAQRAARSLIACGVRLGKISNRYRLFGHRQVGSTACPGDRLYALIQGWDKFSSGRP